MTTPFTLLDESDDISWLKRRPAPVEDTVTYKIWFSKERTVDLATTEQIAIEIAGQLLVYCKDYIWQKEPFRLSAKQEKEGYCLAGSTIFGDCIDDEWFIVFLLREISRYYTDVVIQVNDNDGEFLLIEAAAYLPGWLEPDTSEHRVFLYQGELHIIPLEVADRNTIPTLDQALNAIRDSSVPTRASAMVQQMALRRIENYPKKAQQNIHRATCILPKQIAHLLCHEPQLVAPAVEAFYTRDPIGMKACHTMSRFPPSTSIPVTVRFTRALYAQMVHQQFYPPKSFRLPPPASPDFKATELGMKLACGFEILCATGNLAALNNADITKDVIDTEDYPFTRDQQWIQFSNKLQDTGYYQDEIAGSQLYKELDRKAKEYYLRNKRRMNTRETAVEWAISRIHTLWQLPVETKEIHDRMQLEPEDDDQWLTIDDTELDQMLNNEEQVFNEIIGEESEDEEKEIRQHNNNNDDSQDDSEDSEDDDSVDGDELGRIVQSFRAFVDQDETGLQGAEFPSERELGAEDDIEIAKDKTMTAAHSGPMDAIQLDSMKFFDIAQSLFGTNTNVATETSTDTGKHIDEQPQMELADDEFEAAMNAMDAELATTTLAKSFSRAVNIEVLDEEDFTTSDNLMDNKAADHNENEEEQASSTAAPLEALDLDYNLVKNLLASFESQQGTAGPASNILGRLGVRIPRQNNDNNNNNNNNNNNQASTSTDTDHK
ncbi:SGT1 protein-domain-containing protein [Syncephalis plumigaleata]|nr:SGT1 protein-domain-containing protein [Syncephalis plumigaleata]